MEKNSFAVFILTHGRPDKVITFRSLRKQGYTGPIYLIVDNEDKTMEAYKEIYGEQVITFDKADIASRFDEGDNFQDRRAVFYARNACFEIAAQLGIEYFLQLDDDYSLFVHKFTSRLRFRERPIINLDRVFDAFLIYYKSIPAVTIAMAQNGEFFGGRESLHAKKLGIKRKAMNTFFCSTKRPFAFMGRVNEDVNTYVTLGNRGELIFTVFSVSIIQESTQQSAGGMTELYLAQGTYVKSFYTVMYAPSCVKIGEMGQSYRRIHHKINWANAVPKIIGEEYKKRPEVPE